MTCDPETCKSSSSDDTSLYTRMSRLQIELDEMRETLNFIRDTIVKADTTITKVAEEVMPTVNALMETPIVKMLGVKRK